MQTVKWFHRGTAPMVAIYPDDLDGASPLKPMSVAEGMRPVRWDTITSAVGMCIYPDDCETPRVRPLPMIDRDPTLKPVLWVHSGRQPKQVTYETELPAAGGGEEYEGPLDIVSGAVVAFANRALSAAMLGQPLYTILEDGGSTTQTFSSDAESGDAPVSAINTFLNGADGFVTSWKDQSGNDNHAAQDGVTAIPQWLADAGNGKPGLLGDVDGWLLLNELTIATGQQTVFVVFERDDSPGKLFFIYGEGDGTSSSSLAVMPSSAGAVANKINPCSFDVEGNSSGGMFTPPAWSGVQLLDCAWEYGNQSCRVDNANLTLFRNDEALGPVGNVSGFATVMEASQNKILELIIYDTILTDPQRLAIRQNQAAAHGITLD